MSLRVSTPYGLTRPFAIHHGGAQGDSGGVALFTAVGILRTWTHQRLLRSSTPLTPSDGNSTLDWQAYYPHLPGDPEEPCADFCYSDDRRLFARNRTGLERILRIVYITCTAAGGAPNLSKLKVFRLRRSGNSLQLVPGNIHALASQLPCSRAGLHFANLPLLMGMRPIQSVRRVRQMLTRLLSAFGRHQLRYLLLLRCLLAFIISRLDFLHTAVAPHDSQLRPLQIMLHRAARVLCK